MLPGDWRQIKERKACPAGMRVNSWCLLVQHTEQGGVYVGADSAPMHVAWEQALACKRLWGVVGAATRVTGRLLWRARGSDTLLGASARCRGAILQWAAT